MIATTLNRIWEKHPGADRWQKLLAGLGKTEPDDEPLPFARIVEVSDLDTALWCCRAEPQYAKEWRLFIVWCARQVQHLMTDPRSIAALDVAERHAIYAASDEELREARAAADAATRASAMAATAWERAADRAADAAADAVKRHPECTVWWTANKAATAAADAVREAAEAAAREAKWYQPWKARWRRPRAAATAYTAAKEAAREKQAAEFLRLVTQTEDRS